MTTPEYTQQEIELQAAAYRRLQKHLMEDRKDVQNIDLMNLAGFCRNCLSRWYEEAANASGIPMTKDEARELFYGMTMDEWKANHQAEATPAQQATFKTAFADNVGNDFYVGERAASLPATTQYETSPFKKGRPPEPLQFEINLTAEAHDRQKKSGEVQVNIPGFSPVKLYCDEQTPVGDDTAPPPLAFLSAGIAFCLMTHLTDIYTARKISIKSMKIEQRLRFETNLSNMRDLGHTTDGKMLGIETHVLIDSDEPQERILGLMDEAENACMAHYALRNPIPWSSRLVHNGDEVVSRNG